MSRLGTIQIGDKTYDLDDLTLDEMGEVENLVLRKRELPSGAVIDEPTPFSELNYGSIPAIKAISLVIMRQQDPDLTYEGIGHLKVAGFIQADEEMPELPPEDRGDQESQSQVESPRDDSGAHLSAVSTDG